MSWVFWGLWSCVTAAAAVRGEAGEQRATFFMGLCSNLVLNISYRCLSKLGESRRHTHQHTNKGKGVELTHQLSHSQSLNTKHSEQKQPVLRYCPLPLSPSRHPYSLAAAQAPGSRKLPPPLRPSPALSAPAACFPPPQTAARHVPVCSAAAG